MLLINKAFDYKKKRILQLRKRVQGPDSIINVFVCMHVREVPYESLLSITVKADVLPQRISSEALTALFALQYYNND